MGGTSEVVENDFRQGGKPLDDELERRPLALRRVQNHDAEALRVRARAKPPERHARVTLLLAHLILAVRGVRLGARGTNTPLQRS